jgi:alcohol dehydrogenase (NADP+)
MKSHGYAALAAKELLKPFAFERREPGTKDVVIAIDFCGVCHSDIHQARHEWGPGIFPMVPGHEIVGRVTAVGAGVTKFKVGEKAGVGVMVESCRTCANCLAGNEQYCLPNGAVMTYNGLDLKGEPTYGGYANNIVTDEAFVLRIPDGLDPAAAAPLLCAGITTYSPLRHWKAGPGKKVGVVGLGGLGHMGLKFAHSFGAHVVQFTTSKSKIADAKRLGADEVVISTDAAAMAAHAGSFDLILDAVSAPHDMNQLLGMLKIDGTLVLVGLPDVPLSIDPFLLVGGRRAVAGSAIGGIAETQEMLDYCAEKGIVSDIELTPIAKINEVYERVIKGDVKYRFVIDMASLDS